MLVENLCDPVIQVNCFFSGFIPAENSRVQFNTGLTTRTVLQVQAHFTGQGRGMGHGLLAGFGGCVEQVREYDVGFACHTRQAGLERFHPETCLFPVQSKPSLFNDAL